MDENKKTNELNGALKELWDSLTDEQKEKAKKCQNMDELMLLAGRLGIELPDEMLDVSAGAEIHLPENPDGNITRYCPYCKEKHELKLSNVTNFYECTRKQAFFGIDHVRNMYIRPNQSPIEPITYRGNGC